MWGMERERSAPFAAEMIECILWAAYLEGYF